MIHKIGKMFGIKVQIRQLEGYDTFAGESYYLAGPFFSEAAATRAAKKRLKKLEIEKPSRNSGGQQPAGIQDRVYIVKPDGVKYRYPPETQLQEGNES